MSKWILNRVSVNVWKRLLFFALYLAVIIPIQAEVKLPSIFGDNMVLQQGMPVRVWGWAGQGENVTVSLLDQNKTTTVDQHGKWIVTLDAMKASKTPLTMKVKGKNELVIKNILIGEVWLCSGQSNMAWPLNRTLNAKEEASKAKYPEIRHIQFPAVDKPDPQKDIQAKWKVCSPKTVGGFSAVAYYFARELYEKLDVPIGLVNSSWGGTKIEPWLCAKGIRMIPELTDLRAKVDSWDTRTELGRKVQTEYMVKVREWLKLTEQALKENKKAPRPPKPIMAGKMFYRSVEPTIIFNGMIAPIVGYTIRGAIWYQGESNYSDRGLTYLYKKKALIKGWRKIWGQGDFPFYFTQLANYRSDRKTPRGSDGYSGIRNVQRQCLTIPKTGMAVTIDIGETGNVHPGNKQDVGDRLARWALADTYGKNIIPSGPLYKKHIIEGNKIRVFFDYVGDGLMIGKKKGLDPVKEVKNGKLQRFAIAGKDNQWYWADAEIDGDTIILSSEKVSQPVSISYAHSANPLGCNLYNKNGLPASPFLAKKNF